MPKLIDPMSILYSPARAQKSITGTQKEVIHAFKSLLPSVGWTLTETLHAAGSVEFGLGFPHVDGLTILPKRPVSCPATPFMQFGDFAFVGYDPGKEVPPTPAPCIFFALAISPADSLSSLANAITLATGFTATVVSLPTGFRLDLVDPVGGPDANFARIIGDGRFGGVGTNGGHMVGGGYTFRSSPVEAPQYSVSITGNLANEGRLFFDFTIRGDPMRYVLADTYGGGTILANGYGFCIFQPGDDGDYPFVGRSLFCMAPAMPIEEGFDPSTYGVFILGPRTFRGLTYWFGFKGAITTCLDAPPVTYSNTGGWPRLLALRAPGPPLLTPSGKPIIIAAYVQFGANASSGVDVIGKLWDCAVVSDLVAAGATIDGQSFTTVSSQGGENGQTACSLVMFAPKPVDDPPPPIDPPIYPHTQPTTRNGKCNLFGSGVTALSGSFTGLTHLTPITIDGHPYLIDSVQDATNLTLTTATTIAANVNWTVP